MVNSSQFIHAAQVVHTLKTKPDNTTLGVLYGLYKQATLGNNTSPKPMVFNLVGTTKWNNWNDCKDMSTYDAEVKYITLVNKLLLK